MSVAKYIFYTLSLFVSVLTAQNKQLLYDFNEIPQALMLNPGMETSFKWYSGVPMLSGISGYAGSNGISVNDIFADDGVDINLKVREKMVAGLSSRDEFSGNVQLEYINVGFRSKDPSLFFTIGGYFEFDEILYWPKDYAILAFEGNADQLNRRFDLSDLKTRGSLVNVMHIGLNKTIDRNLTVGIRGKLYSGIMDYNSTKNDGVFVNTPGQNNRIATTLNADLELRTSGVQSMSDANGGRETAAVFAKRALFGGDLGLGLDLGATYHLTERTTLTASLLDLGFMYHTNDTENYSLQGRITVEGIEINVLEQFGNLDRDFWQDLVDDIETLIPFETRNDSYVTFRPTRLYGSIRHDFGQAIGGERPMDCDCSGTGTNAASLRSKYRNSVGAQIFMVNRPRGPQTALTAFYQRRFGNFMSLRGTYTADKFTLSNVGLGINFQAGPLNLYAMADNLLSYQNITASNYASFQFGLNIISWGRN